MIYPNFVDKFAVELIFHTYPYTRFLGQGAYKYVYQSNNKAISIISKRVNGFNFKKEQKFLTTMKDIGLPVPRFYKIMEFKDYYVVSQKLYSPLTKLKPFYPQFITAAEKILKSGLYIDDLQVLLDKDKLVFIDPLGIIKCKHQTVLFVINNHQRELEVAFWDGLKPSIKIYPFKR